VGLPINHHWRNLVVLPDNGRSCLVLLKGNWVGLEVGLDWGDGVNRCFGCSYGDILDQMVWCLDLHQLMCCILLLAHLGLQFLKIILSLLHKFLA
jgi:hypothetical protein